MSTMFNVDFGRLLKSQQLGLFGTETPMTQSKKTSGEKPKPKVPAEKIGANENMPQTMSPELGERRIINGTAYVFLETTPELPRWHRADELKKLGQEYSYDLFSQPSTPAKKKPSEMNKEEFDSKVYQQDKEGRRILSGENLQTEREGNKWNILWDGEPVKTGLDLGELKKIMADPTGFWENNQKKPR